MSPPQTRIGPLLEVRQLEVVYNHVATAVQGVSLEVADRQIVAMIGTNGAGKTTTLRAISGFLPAEDVAITDGTVTFGTKAIAGRLPHDISRRGVVLVPERNKLFDTLTVQENLHFNLTRRRRAIRDKVFDYFPRLGERKSQIAGLLSGGEKQMLAIGMSLVCEPKLLLVDELSLGLAPIVTEEIMGILQSINGQLGLAMLIVEQNAAAALRIASFGYVLEGGRVVFKGPCAKLMEHQDIKEFYLGGADGKTRSYRDLRQYARKKEMVGMSARGTVLRIENVTLQFGGISAIKSVAFEAQPSELLAVVGPNGAGKTAMLNCISGIYRPTAGDIFLDGASIVGQPLHRMVKLGIGRAFQHAELFPHLTVTENLLIGRHTKFRRGLWASGLYVGSTRRDETNERRHVEGIIDFFEIYRHRDMPVGSLPYGVQKLVSVARALAMGPKLLLLDEPCTGLIREERENLARFLLRIRHEFGPTIIWVEHDMQMVSDLADRVVVLNHGTKVIEGPPDEVRRSPAVIEAYLGKAAGAAVS